MTFGDIVMLSEVDRGGAGAVMHMSDWVGMLLEGSRRQTSLGGHKAHLVAEVGSEPEPTSLCRSVTLSLPGEGGKTDWSPAKTHFFENRCPYSRLLSAQPGSAQAGLISTDPARRSLDSSSQSYWMIYC